MNDVNIVGIATALKKKHCSQRSCWEKRNLSPARSSRRRTTRRIATVVSSVVAAPLTIRSASAFRASLMAKGQHIEGCPAHDKNTARIAASGRDDAEIVGQTIPGTVELSDGLS